MQINVLPHEQSHDLSINILQKTVATQERKSVDFWVKEPDHAETVSPTKRYLCGSTRGVSKAPQSLARSNITC